MSYVAVGVFAAAVGFFLGVVFAASADFDARQREEEHE